MRWFLSHHSVLSCINGGLGFEPDVRYFYGSKQKGPDQVASPFTLYEIERTPIELQFCLIVLGGPYLGTT
jgi:hypothetical protein